jgi:CMP-N-acetylneuraminic acid synthetase
MRCLCTILARAGSVGVPGRTSGCWAACSSSATASATPAPPDCSTVWSSATNAPAVARIAVEEGVDPVIDRAEERATESAGELPAIVHAVVASEAALGAALGVVFGLDATSPLRIPEDVMTAVVLLEDDPDTAKSSPARCSSYFNLVEREADRGVRLVRSTDPPLLRRQDTPDCFGINASIDVWRRATLS